MISHQIAIPAVVGLLISTLVIVVSVCVKEKSLNSATFAYGTVGHTQSFPPYYIRAEISNFLWLLSF